MFRDTFILKTTMKIKGTKFKMEVLLKKRKRDKLYLEKGTVKTPKTLIMFHFLSWVVAIYVCFTKPHICDKQHVYLKYIS